ncbi:MAG: DMT family transporter [Lachnospiraceae bacterium]|nr:DMT family transporter [Lachnospiraceae bacterium]
MSAVMILVAMFCCLLWGSAFPCIKIGYSLFEIESGEIWSQILFAGVRFAIAGMMVIAFSSIGRKKFIRPAQPKRIFVLSMCQTVVQYLFFYVGLAHTTGVKSSIITGIGTFLTILVSCLVFKQEKLTGLKIFGSLLGFAGIIIVNMNGATLDFNLSIMGEGFIFMSALSSAFSSAIIKEFSKESDVVMLCGYQFFFGGIIMAVVGFAAGGKLIYSGPSCIALILYMGFISAAAYTLWSLLLKYNDVSKVSTCKFMNPIFGVLLSFLILKEQSSLGWQVLIALLLVSVGIYVVNYKKSVGEAEVKEI